MRKTVTFTTPTHTTARKFHLEAAKAKRFAAHIIAKGGTAEIGPLDLDNSTIEMLRRAGVNPAAVH
jgi:hypothetical protein